MPSGQSCCVSARGILMSSYSWMFSKENKTQLLHFMLICLAILKGGCKICV